MEDPLPSRVVKACNVPDREESEPTRAMLDNGGLRAVGEGVDLHCEHGGPYNARIPVRWRCRECEKECSGVTESSLCICGHRFRDHHHRTTMTRAPVMKNEFQEQRNSSALESEEISRDILTCSKPLCSCSGFFFIVAQGSWVLRCRCKVEF
eukprot:TRINITY_DN9662_c0_g1_i2.p1 TRINITY_DN9662_c0_g1~~TRINITY_DN9662_c0_g1_i2.p1  ORF type:complete len:169 (+),score=14.15 TRINITY_DN9662_c0_g1_i2:53-508(+)